MLRILSKLLISSSFAIICAAQGARAGLYLEPYLGYGVGTFTLESSLGDNESDVNGPQIGFRAGYAKLGFFIAPDFNFGFPGSFEPSINDPNLPTNSVVSRNGDANQGSIFLTAGYKPPVLPLRFYIGYGLFHSYSLDFDGGEDIDFEGSGGIKVGAGWKPGFLFLRLPLSIDLEYKIEPYQEATGVGSLGDKTTEFPFITGNTPTNFVLYNDADIQTISILISAPFTLFD